jgi:Fe-S-cluster-containing dehydrogenase component
MAQGSRLFIDYSKCIGCETCEAVCKFTHGMPRIHMTRTREGLMVPLYCQHCDKPACVRACPHGALEKDEQGAVLQNLDVCATCTSKDCLDACPFGAVFCTGTATSVLKCDMCAERRSRGLGPACVAMCPCEAILHVDRDRAKTLQTPEAAQAFKRVIEHIKPPKELKSVRPR